MSNDAKPTNKSFLDSLNSVLKGAGDVVNDVAGKVGGAVNDAAGKVGAAVVDKVDLNGSGTIDIEDFIIMGLRLPGIGINRKAFLRAELQNRYPEDVVEKAIDETPAKAGIPVEAVNKIADSIIAYERNCVSGISTVLGIPGGYAMAATIPTDIAQYYGFMLRAAQKLLYLYGFPQINTDEREQVFDTDTLNMLTLCLGVMYGVAGANKALVGIANALAKGVEKQLLQKALTKGTLYPIVKNVAKWFGMRMTKQVFAGFFKKAIPIVGGVLGGSITYLSFKPCCDKLKDSLRNTILSNPDGTDVVETELVIEDEDSEGIEESKEE